MSKVLENGVPRKTRTGVNTRGIFGERIKGYIGGPFPVLTSKYIFWKGVVEELLWMISGSTNAKVLSDKGVKIWDAWADPNTGELGPTYGHNWRNYGGKVRAIKQPPPKLRKDLVATYLGVGNGANKEGDGLKKVWEGMLQRCYDPKSISYSEYGLRGVFVCDRWLEFSKFADDAKRLPNWSLKEASPELYQIDKDGIGDGFTYGPDTCQWVTPEQNESYKHTTEYVVAKEGKEYRFTNVTKFCAEHGLEAKNFSDLWTGNKNAQNRNGFTFVRKNDLSQGEDQLGKAIELIENDPTSRRIVVNSWNAKQTHLMALPPCHLMYQFYADDRHDPLCESHMMAKPENTCCCDHFRSKGPQSQYPKKYLDCMVTMRSSDVFLGLPFNIASYALLTHMVARVTGREPRNLTMNLGDTHIYENHVALAYEQLNRNPPSPPQLDLSNAPTDSIDKFEAHHIVLRNYNPLSALKTEVAV